MSIFNKKVNLILVHQNHSCNYIEMGRLVIVPYVVIHFGVQDVLHLVVYTLLLLLDNSSQTDDPMSETQLSIN